MAFFLITIDGMLNNEPQVNQTTQEPEVKIRLPRVRRRIRNAFRKVLRRDRPSTALISGSNNKFQYGYVITKEQKPYIRTNIIDLSQVKFTVKNKDGEYSILERDMLSGATYKDLGRYTRKNVTIKGQSFKSFTFEVEKGFKGQIVLTIPSLKREVVFNFKEKDNWQESAQLPSRIEKFKEFDLLANNGVLLSEIKSGAVKDSHVYFDRSKLKLTNELATLKNPEYPETFLDLMRVASPKDHDYRVTLSSTTHETVHAVASRVSDLNPLNRHGVTFNEDGTMVNAVHNRSYAIILPKSARGLICEHPPAFINGALLLDRTVSSYPLKASMGNSFNKYANHPAFKSKRHLPGFLLEELNGSIMGNRVTRQTLNSLSQKGIKLSEQPLEARLQAYKMLVREDERDEDVKGYDEAAPVFELSIGVLAMAKILRAENKEFYDQSGFEQVVDELCSIGISEFKLSRDAPLRNGYEEVKKVNGAAVPISVDEYLKEIRTSESCSGLRDYIKQNLPKVTEELGLK